jgi:hypothetical protein
LPTAGAIATVKGYATKELDGTYGSDVAFHELATDSGRFKGFKARVQRQPIQSFWSNTIEVGLAVHLAVLCVALVGFDFAIAQAIATVAAMTGNFTLNNPSYG